MALHIFAHVEAQQLDAHDIGELFGDFGLADARRAGKEITADRLFRLAKPGARKLDGGCQRMNGRILSINDALQIVFQRPQRFGIGFGHGFGWDARDLGHHIFDFAHADDFLALVLRQKHLRGAHLIDDVDGLVRQFPVIDIFRRQFDGGFHRFSRVADLVVILEIGLQPAENLDRVGNGWLRHVDFLEAADQRAVFLEILAIFLVGR